MTFFLVQLSRLKATHPHSLGPRKPSLDEQESDLLTQLLEDPDDPEDPKDE